MKFVLRPRQKNLQGIPNWHDSVVLQWALDRIGQGKPLSQMGVWLGLAKKIQVAQAEAGFPSQVNVEVPIEVEDGEAKLLWGELGKLPPEAFGRSRFTGQPEVPSLATLGEMLEDWGEQLQKEGYGG